MEFELISVEETYEDDELVLMKAKYGLQGGFLVNTDVGVKNGNGDIVKITTVNTRLITDI